MHVFCSCIQINILEQGIVFRSPDELVIVPLENLSVNALAAVAFLIVISVVCDFVDKKQAEHLYPMFVEYEFLVEMFLYGFPDLLFFDSQIVYVSHSLADPQYLRLCRK